MPLDSVSGSLQASEGKPILLCDLDSTFSLNWFLHIFPASISYLSNGEYHNNSLLELLSGFTEMKHITCLAVLVPWSISINIGWVVVSCHDWHFCSTQSGTNKFLQRSPAPRRQMPNLGELPSRGRPDQALAWEILTGLMEKPASTSSSSKSDEEPSSQRKILGACTGQGPGIVARYRGWEKGNWATSWVDLREECRTRMWTGTEGWEVMERWWWRNDQSKPSKRRMRISLAKSEQGGP